MSAHSASSASEHERRLEAIIAAADAVVYMATPEGIVLSWSSAAQRMFGYAAEEIVGKPVTTLIPEELQGEERESMKRLARGEEVRYARTDRVHQDGTRRTVAVTMVPVRDASGRVVEVTRIVRDVSMIQRMEAALRDSEQRFRDTLDSIMEGVQVLGFDWRYLYINEAAAAHNRRPNRDLLGRVYMECWPGIEEAQVFGPLKRAMEERIPQHAQVEYEFQDGTVAHFDLRIQPVPEGVFIHSIEVTGQLQAERQAAIERQFSDAMIESLPGVAYFYDESGRFLRWNRNLLSVTGYTAEQLATMHPLDFFRGEERIRVGAAIARTFADGEVMLEAGMATRDGVVTPYVFTGRRLEMAGNRYLVGVGLDISALKAAEAEVRNLNEALELRIRERTAQLEEANRELESFSYSISHDLRAPLRSINGFSETLLQDFAGDLPAEPRRCLERVHQAGQRMSELIDDLLDLSRLARQSLRRRPVDMTALARSVAADVQAENAGRGIDLRIDALPPCEGDASLLRQVWVNLLSNAFKYTRQRQPAIVEVGSMMRDGAQVYFVRDNGTGFDMRHAGRLFGVFQRLHSAEQFEGTGVGLAIVSRILRRHGGRIWAEAAPDRGATFYFTFDGAGA